MTPEASGSGAGDERRGVAGTDTQRMLFHVPDGAGGTVDGLIGAGVDVTADDEISDPVGLAAGGSEDGPLAGDPTQPATASATRPTTALHLRQARPWTLDSTVGPSGRSKLR